MPLLGKKIFDPGIAVPKPEDNKESFVIPHTKEVFYSESEYKMRQKLYEKNIWTCQCTGHINLTHKEALQSEKTCRERMLRFGEVWEKPVLSLVQHSFVPLDIIIAQAHNMLMTKLVPDEKVIFSVSKAGKTFEATVVKRYEVDETNSTSSDEDCIDVTDSLKPATSPKENKACQLLITDVFKPDTRRSPRSPSIAHVVSDVATKGKKLSLLPAKYDILLATENKIVSKVPCEHLTRTQRPPSREIIRLFIRANAVRLQSGKEKLPWLVDEDMVFRHALESHISAEEEKRMVQQCTITCEGYLKETEVRHNKSSSHAHMNGDILSNGMSDSVEATTITSKKLDEKKPSSTKSIAPIFSVKKRKNIAPISNDKAKKSKLNAHGKKKSSGGKGKVTNIDFFLKKNNKCNDTANKKKGNNTKLSTPKKKKKKETEDSIVVIDIVSVTPNRKGKGVTAVLPMNSPKKNADRPSGSSRKNSVPKKKKQATLLELTKKGGGVKLLGSPSPSKSQKATPSKPRKPRQPIIVLQLMSLKKEKKFRPHKYKMTVTAACKVLTEKQRGNLPAEVRDDIMKKWELEEKKRKFKMMTRDEKRAYLAEQRKAKKLASGDFPQKQEKYEDQHLSGAKNLSDLDLVPLPENLPNTSFGDVAMLCEFLHSYHSLLCPKDNTYHKQFNVRNITEAVTEGKTGFRVTGKILVLFLQTLLADDIARDYCEVEYPLNQILVTPEVTCELTRACLRQHDDEPDDAKSESSSNADLVDTCLSDSTSRKLLEMELYEMDPVEQVEILSMLAYRVMNTYAVQAHMEDTMLKAATIWNKVVQQKKERKQELKEKGLAEPTKKQDPKPQPGEQLQNFDNANPTKGETNSTTKEEPKSTDLEIDLVSRVKQRKMLSEQHKREEEERRRKLKEEQDQLLEEQKSRQEREKTSKQLAETRLHAVHVRRRVPLGTDRNHSRYWLFCDGVPGLYIEKGWMGEHISYNTMADTDDEPLLKTPRKFSDSGGPVSASPSKFPRTSTASSDEDELPLSQLSTPTKKRLKFKKSKEEVTWPRSGQNMWMHIDSQEKLDRLMKNLCTNGIRESKLHRALEKNYDVIIRSLTKRKGMMEATAEPVMRRSTLPADGDELHKSIATKNLQHLIRETCRGGLAEIDEPDVFEQRVATFDNVTQFATALLELFEAIPKRCLKRYMTGIPDKKKKSADQTDVESASDREKVKAERRVSKWKLAVEETTLYSRFCLLLAILNNSIKWDLYHYRRVNARRTNTRGKNYAAVEEDDNDELEEEEEEEEQESEDSEEDLGQRRSSRIREKRKTKVSEEEMEVSESSDEDVYQRRSSRIKKKPRNTDEAAPPRRSRRKPTRYRMEDSDSDDDEEEQDEDDDSDEEESNSDSSSTESNEVQEQESEDEDEEEEEEDDSEACRNIIQKIMKYQYADMFRDPVIAEDVPDYYEIITQPICLSDILEKINEKCKNAENDDSGNGSTSSSYTFENLMNDVRLMLDNAALYNTEDSFVMKQAYKLESTFVRLCRDSIDDPLEWRRLRSLFKGPPR